jgi:hypothetical protein
MSKGIFPIFILLLLAFQNDKSSTLKINSSPFENLNGKIKRIIETDQHHLSGIINEYGDTTEFDRNGNQTTVLPDRKTGKDRIAKFDTKYDKNGKKIESRLSANDGQTILKYDANGYIIKSWFQDKNNNQKYQTTYKYDDSGRLIEQDYILPENGLQKLIFKYDSGNHLVESDLFSGKNGLFEKSLFQCKSFDSKNNWTKRIKISEFGLKFDLRRDTSISYRKITYY